MKWIVFFVAMPLIAVAIIMEFFNVKLKNWLCGYSGPKMQSIEIFCHHWKDLWNIKPVEARLNVIDGYMYVEVTYSDGSKLYRRE